MRCCVRHIIVGIMLVIVSTVIFSCIPKSSLKSYVDNQVIRVLIGNEKERFSLLSRGFFLVDGIPFDGEIVVEISNSCMVINGIQKDKKVEIYSDDYISYRGTEYSGTITLIFTNKSVMVVNNVDIEEYLESVVPSEVPALWPIEVLRAQAIVSRTYAIRKMIDNKNKDYDVVSTYMSQVYSGRKRVHPRTTKAVRDTRGVVITHNDEIILAFFHANSGGLIETPEVIGGRKLPYLKPMRDNFSRNTFRSYWSSSIDSDEFVYKLFGRRDLKLVSINLPKRLPSGSVTQVEVLVKDNRTTYSKVLSISELRGIFPVIMSPKFEIDINGGVINFRGIGWGHGVGMSQWGANKMAKQGYSYKEIIMYYYDDVKLVKLY
ncbi:MAG: SpoIID/LytB domain-containing protein [Brevinematales bacterium]|nr:SpoIID/LytB domain-containing protein [Brevinematales bacterium]